MTDRLSSLLRNLDEGACNSAMPLVVTNTDIAYQLSKICYAAKNITLEEFTQQIFPCEFADVETTINHYGRMQDDFAFFWLALSEQRQHKWLAWVQNNQ